MKISFKLPMADDLAAALCAMSDKDAGAAFKAALVYRAGGETSALSPRAKLAFSSMRELIDLSRMKAAAGRAGGKVESFSGGKSGEKQTFANDSAGGNVGSTAGGTVGSSAGSKPQPAPDGVDLLAGLDAFL